MEEDLKLLENFCEVFRMTQRSIDKYERAAYGEIIGQEEIQAIENLIARNKELENELMEKELAIDGLKEDRKIAIEEIQEEYYVSKDKLRNLEVIVISGFEVISAEDIRELLEERN